MVSDAVALIRTPRDGVAGIDDHDGNDDADGRDGVDGRDVDMDAVAKLIAKLWFAAGVMAAVELLVVLIVMPPT